MKKSREFSCHFNLEVKPYGGEQMSPQDILQLKANIKARLKHYTKDLWFVRKGVEYSFTAKPTYLSVE